jgi:hypothetical protein
VLYADTAIGCLAVHRNFVVVIVKVVKYLFWHFHFLLHLVPRKYEINRRNSNMSKEEVYHFNLISEFSNSTEKEKYFLFHFWIHLNQLRNLIGLPPCKEGRYPSKALSSIDTVYSDTAYRFELLALFCNAFFESVGDDSSFLATVSEKLYQDKKFKLKHKNQQQHTVPMVSCRWELDWIVLTAGNLSLLFIGVIPRFSSWSGD